MAGRNGEIARAPTCLDPQSINPILPPQSGIGRPGRCAILRLNTLLHGLDGQFAT